MNDSAGLGESPRERHLHHPLQDTSQPPQRQVEHILDQWISLLQGKPYHQKSGAVEFLEAYASIVDSEVQVT